MSQSLLFFLAFGLAMDAFAVSLSNGMTCRISPWRNAFLSGLAFGIFQALMPLLGYLAGHSFRHLMERVDHWIALLLLCGIGAKMIWECLQERKHTHLGGFIVSRRFSFRTLLLQAVATSIDALAAGVGLGVMHTDVYKTIAFIGGVTFVCCFAGVLIGRRFGRYFQGWAGLVGGLLLIFIGFHIFFDHTVHHDVVHLLF